MTIGIMVGGQRSDWATLTSSSGYSLNKAAAGEDLPRGAYVSIPLTEAKNIILNQSKFRITSEILKPKEIYFQGNQLYSEGTPTLSWISSLSLAEDVHSEVASLSISSDTPLYPHNLSIFLTITKPVQKGDEISVWFSSQLASDLGLPFLTFSHIKDGRYVCPICSKRFLAPNPLKLHLATSCDTISSDVLWERIINPLALTNFCPPWKTQFITPTKSVNEDVLSYSKNCLQALNSSYLSYSLNHSQKNNPSAREVRSLSSDDSTNKNLSLSKNSLSAFKPFISNSNREIKIQELDSQNKKFMVHASPANFLSYTDTGSSSILPSLSRITNVPYNSVNSNVPQWPDLSRHPSISSILNTRLLNVSSSNSTLLASLPSTSASDPCAEVETLVSNLGRGKGSHLCLYCGKVYSRKYGLKIHIRTHTGYKPLKCRICLRPFGDPSNLNKHVRLHAQGGTPYGCELCGKVLVRRRDLERHLRSRHSNVVFPRVKKTDEKEKNSEKISLTTGFPQDTEDTTQCSEDTIPIKQCSEDTSLGKQCSEDTASIKQCSEDTLHMKQCSGDTSHSKLLTEHKSPMKQCSGDTSHTKNSSEHTSHSKLYSEVTSPKICSEITTVLNSNNGITADDKTDKERKREDTDCARRSR